jgi:predicted SprT family Zn-dependent metalloprotease
MATTSTVLDRMVAVHAEAAGLLRQHGLAELGWKFRINSRKRAVGLCSYTSKTIHVSQHYIQLTPPEEITDTILHEIAHALSYTRYGSKGRGHGFLWKQVCREIGADPTRVTEKAVSTATPNYTIICRKCGVEVTRHRMKIDPNNVKHGSGSTGCGGKMDVYRNIDGRRYLLTQRPIIGIDESIF